MNQKKKKLILVLYRLILDSNKTSFKESVITPYIAFNIIVNRILNKKGNKQTHKRPPLK